MIELWWMRIENVIDQSVLKDDFCIKCRKRRDSSIASFDYHIMNRSMKPLKR